MAIDKKSSYYDAGGIEVLEVIKAKLTKEQFKGYLLGNIIKYSCRLNFKEQQERDSEKIIIYGTLLEKMLKSSSSSSSSSSDLSTELTSVSKEVFQEVKPVKEKKAYKFFIKIPGQSIIACYCTNFIVFQELQRLVQTHKIGNFIDIYDTYLSKNNEI